MLISSTVPIPNEMPALSMCGNDISTCSVCGDTEKNVINGDLPKWWIRAFKYGARSEARLLCAECAMVIPYKARA